MTFASLTLVSRVAGGARDFVVAKVIGASQSMAADAYFTALTFPNLFRRVQYSRRSQSRFEAFGCCD